MSEESHHRGRSLREAELVLLLALLNSAPSISRGDLSAKVVENMSDGGMGSVRFLNNKGREAPYGATIAEAEYVDTDGMLVSIAVNIDERGDLLEIDFWKVDFSPLRKYPLPAELIRKGA